MCSQNDFDLETIDHDRAFYVGERTHMYHTVHQKHVHR